MTKETKKNSATGEVNRASVDKSKRSSVSLQIILYLSPILLVAFLDKDNVLRLDASVGSLVWTILFPTLLFVSLALLVWVYPRSRRYRDAQNAVYSTRMFRFFGSALLVILPPVVLSSMAETVVGIYVNFTATSPIVVVIDDWETAHGRSSTWCDWSIEIHGDAQDFRYLCLRRPFGPAIETEFVADGGSLCIKGRESSVGAVVDQVTTIAKGLDMDAKRLLCTQTLGVK